TGCSMATTAKLYPVKGPYSEQRPIPILKAQVQGVQGYSGDVTLTLPDGEICTGSWSSLAPQQISMTSVSGIGAFRRDYKALMPVFTELGLPSRIYLE